MGLSLQSALMIQGNEILVDTYSNKEKIGYGFIVYMLKREEIHTKIVSTLPYFPYASKEKAKEIGDALVKEVKEMDLSSKISGLQKILSPPGSKIVSEITHIANNPTKLL